MEGPQDLDREGNIELHQLIQCLELFFDASEGPPVLQQLCNRFKKFGHRLIDILLPTPGSTASLMRANMQVVTPMYQDFVALLYFLAPNPPTTGSCFLFASFHGLHRAILVRMTRQPPPSPPSHLPHVFLPPPLPPPLPTVSKVPH